MGRTTTAERSALENAADPKTARAGYYVWSFPGAPVQVRLDLTVVARLAGAMAEGAAVSGLLLGSAYGSATEITDFNPLPDSADPGFEPAIESAVHKPGPARVVGFYRTHGEELLHLNPDDYSLAERWFRDPHSVFLLVRPSASEAANATFFFRDGRGMNGDFPFLEFPFDASRLRAGHHVSNSPGEELPAPSLDAIPRETYRGGAAEAAPPRHIHRVKTFVVSAGIICLLGAAAYGAYRLLPAGNAAKGSPAAPANTAHSLAPSLGLRAERQNGDLKLTWNRESPTIEDASSGVLSILDGNSRRDLSLTASQVRGGSLLYSPSSDQVQMQLAVTGGAGVSEESVIVILPKGGAPAEVRPLPRAAPKNAVGETERPTESAERSQPTRPFVPPQTRVQQPAPIAVGAPPPASVSVPAGAPAPFLTAQLREPPPPPAKPVEPAIASLRNDAPATRPLPPPYRPPLLVRQVMPIIPPMLKSILVLPRTVEVKLSIDATGKVIKAEGVPQPNIPRLLVMSAETAARQCRFQPAVSGNQPVASEMILRFQFKPGQ
jgi:hypothetical protein